MLGIIIAIGAVMTIIAIGDGARKQIKDTLAGLGTKIIIINGQTSLYSSNPMTVQDAENIKNSVAYIEYAISVMGGANFIVNNGKKTTKIHLLGTFPEFFNMMNLKISYGRDLEEDDIDKLRPCAVIGFNIANELFGRQNVIGEKIRLVINSSAGGIVEVPFEIIGVIEKTGSIVFFNVDDLMIIPYTVGEYRIMNSDYSRKAPQIIASFIDENTSDLAIAGVDLYLFNKFKDTKYYSITSQSAMLESANQIVGIINVILVGIAAISLVVGGIGIMNIMLVTVKERTREIGIKMAIGATRQRILLEFLVESIILTVVAGLIGIMLGGLLSSIIAFFGRSFGLTALVTWRSILFSFGVSAGVGLFFGIYPANQASKLSPVEALKYE
jgi:putative ABC transport system permease protein